MNVIHVVYQYVGRLSQKKFLLWLCIASFMIRAAVTLSFADISSPQMYEHGEIADNLYHGHGFSMHWPYDPIDSHRTALFSLPPQHEGAFIPPLHPYLIYGIYLIFGNGSLAVIALLVLNLLVSTLLPVVTYLVTKSLSHENAARLSSCITALFLPATMAITTFSGSVYYQLLVLVNLLMFIKLHQTGWLRYYVYAAISTGAMILLRSEYLILGFVLFGVSYVLTSQRRRIFGLLLFFVVTGAVVGAWTYRNYQLFGTFVPVLSHPWFEIWRGNNPQATGTATDTNGNGIWVNSKDFPEIIHALDALPYDAIFEVRTNSIFKHEVLTYWGEDPVRYILLAGKKLLFFFTIDFHNPSSSNIYYLLFSIAGWAAICFGYVKVWQNRNLGDNRFILSLFGVFFLYYVGLTMTTFMLPRYQIYVMVALLPVAGMALSPNTSDNITL